MSVFDMETPKTGWIHSEVETGLTYFNIFFALQLSQMGSSSWSGKMAPTTPAEKKRYLPQPSKTNLLVSCMSVGFRRNSTSPHVIRACRKSPGQVILL